MKFSKFFAPTLKKAPKDAVLKSHIYLIRAGFIHQVGSGIYNFLPLGKIVLEKIKNIIKTEMDKASAIEISMGFLTPATLWKESKRYEFYGDELAIFKDRKNQELVLGPTHEECVTSIANSFLKSHNQLPINLYQINIKFRDELRPRFGLLRAREFIMKDAYSFHKDTDSLDSEFQNMFQTYSRIFNQLDLDYRAIEADSGAIGGSGSREFSAICDAGEDNIIICSNCDYSSNIEAAKRLPKISNTIPPQANKKYHKFYTPNINSIDDLSKFFNVDSFYIIKTIVKRVIFLDGSSTLAFFFLRGVDNLESTKALNALKRLDTNVFEMLECDKEFLKEHKLPVGFLGPISIKTLYPSNLIIFDEELRDGSELICGANEDDNHYVGVDLSEFLDLIFDDLIQVNEGDFCIHCGFPLKLKKGIEIGHIFKLGTKYSESMKASFLNENGRLANFFMGCYGIGVTRLLSVILEQKSDEFGCVWGNVAPFKIDIIISNMRNDDEVNFANSIYDFLKNEKVEVILDDRKDGFGVKISDFELIGFSYALIVGKKIKEQKVEIIERKNLQKSEIDISNFEYFKERLRLILC